jgi:hypothetical protein
LKILISFCLEKILKKIQELKSKKNVVSEWRKSESKKRKGINEPYNSKSCKRKCTKSVVSEPDHLADHKFSKGETVAHLLQANKKQFALNLKDVGTSL